MMARKSLLILVTQGALVAVGFLGNTLLAQFWGSYAKEALGTIWFSMAFVGLFWGFSDLGFISAHIKRISEGKDLGECVGTFTLIKAALTVVLVFVVLGSI